MNKVIINVNLDAKCKRCGKKGATQNGLCMKCIAGGVKRGEFNHVLKPLQDKVRREINK